MTVEQEVRELNFRRLKIWERAKELLDRAAGEGRGLTAEESANYDRANADITALDRERDELLRSDRAQCELEDVNEELRKVTTPGERRDVAHREDKVRELFRRNSAVEYVDFDLRNASYVSDAVRAGARGAELRAVLGDSGASGGSLTIPTTVESTIWSYFVSSNAMRRLPCTVITTDGGEPHGVPKVTTHAIATQVANQSTAFAGTDPIIGTTVLNAYDYGELCAVSNDLAEDSAVNLVEFIGKELAGSVGRLTSQKYITGTGSGEPTGVMTAVTGAGTIATGGSLIAPTYEKLIDLIYSVPNQYRASGKAAFLMHDLTAASLRKLRDNSLAGGTSGAFLWNGSPTAGMAGGQPDTLLGYPVEIDAGVASLASNAKVVAFGGWDAYWIRDVRGLRVERSQDLYFHLNQTAWRALLRTDGNLVDTQGPAINIIKASV